MVVSPCVTCQGNVQILPTICSLPEPASLAALRDLVGGVHLLLVVVGEDQQNLRFSVHELIASQVGTALPAVISQRLVFLTRLAVGRSKMFAVDLPRTGVHHQLRQGRSRLLLRSLCRRLLRSLCSAPKAYSAIIPIQIEEEKLRIEIEPPVRCHGNARLDTA